MTHLKNRLFEDNNDDINEEKMKELWGGSWKKLTLKQRQLVSGILSELKPTMFKHVQS